jgi:hypothetical protein
MPITQGNILSNYRYNPITAAEVTETVTAESAVCAELLPELPGIYGFELRECPQSSPPGITSVTRVSGGISFSYTASTPGPNQYFIDYTNNSPVVIVPSSNDGLQFTVAYTSVGAPDSVKNSQLISASAGSIEGIIKANRVTSYSTAVDVTKTISGKHASVFNLSVATTKTLTVDQAVYGGGVLHVFGDLTLTGTAVLSLKRTLLIVYGNILGSGTISCPKGANGGNAATSAGTTGTNGDSSAVEIGSYSGGLGGLWDFVLTGGGGGGGGAGYQAGGNGATHTTPAGSPSNGAGGGGAAYNQATPSSVGAGVAYFIGTGGNGGTTTNGAPGDNGGGGGAGGVHLNIICFGTISSSITLRSGLPGEGGAKNGNANVGNGGTAGDLNLWSQYTSAPCTVQVSRGTTYGGTARDGANGTANYNSLDSSNMIAILNSLTVDPLQVLANVNQIGNLYYTKQGTTF